MLLFGCGTCVYNDLYLRFPPISSWCVIFPVWLVILSAIRSTTQPQLRFVPPIWLALPLVFLISLFAPSTMGPMLGFWIPPLCIFVTLWSLHRSGPSQRLTLIAGAIAVAALVTMAIVDVAAFERLTPEQRDALRPSWHRSTPGEPIVR